MERSLNIQINCGDKTCHSEPGKPCGWLRSARFGTIWTCQIFCECETPINGTLYPDSLEEKDGWMQRHPKCLAAEEDFKSALDFVGRMP